MSNQKTLEMGGSMSVANWVREAEWRKCCSCGREEFFVFVVIRRKRQVRDASCPFGWWRSISAASFGFLVVAVETLSRAGASARASRVKSILDPSLRLIPHLWQVIAPEQHKERSNELIRLFFPLLNEIAFDIVNHFFPFMFHFIEFVLQSEFLLTKERNVEFLGCITSLQISTNVQIVVFHDPSDNRWRRNTWNNILIKDD